MIKIIVDEKHKSKIEQYIESEQKTYRTRTIDYLDIETAITVIENSLNKIPKKCWEGCRWLVLPSQEKFPSAYKYKPMGTGFELERKSGKWYLLGIERYNCNGAASKAISLIQSTDAFKNAAIESYKYNFM